MLDQSDIFNLFFSFSERYVETILGIIKRVIFRMIKELICTIVRFVFTGLKIIGGGMLTKTVFDFLLRKVL